MPRVVVPTESEERALDQSHRRRKVLLLIVLALALLAAATAAGLTMYRRRTPKASADTVFVSAPAWPKSETRLAAPRPPIKEWLLVVAAFANKKDADALAARLTGIGWPVSVVLPVSATDSLNKVIVSGMVDGTTARRLADSLGSALGRQIAIIEPTGTRAR